MRSVIAIIIICGIHFFAKGQFVFQKTFDGGGWNKANNIEVIDNNNYIISGSSSGSPYIIKMNGKGDTLITRVLGITSDKSKIMIGNGGAFYIAGHTTDFGAGNSDMYILKTDTNLNLQWVKSYGGGGNDFINQVQRTSDDGLLIIGSTSSYGAGFSDAYLIKTDVNGDTIWSKTYGTVGGEGINYIMEIDSFGYMILGGTDINDPGYGDVYLVKINAASSHLWSITFASPGTSFTDVGYSILPTTNGNYLLLAGSGSFTNGGLWLTSIDSNGNVLWSKTYGDSCGAIAYAFERTDNSGYIFAGNYCYLSSFNSKAFLMQIDSNGSVIWAKAYAYGNNSSNEFKDVKQTSDGGFIAVGETGDLTTRSVYVVKTDAYGNSGCEDSTINIVITDVTPTVSTPPTQVGSGGVVGSTTTVVSGTNTTDNTLCFDTITALPENTTPQMHMRLRAYPNPFTNKTTLTFELPGNITHAELTLTGLSGRTEKSYALQAPYSPIVIHDDGLAAGFYLARIVTGKKTVASAKLIVLP